MPFDSATPVSGFAGVKKTVCVPEASRLVWETTYTSAPAVTQCAKVLPSRGAGATLKGGVWLRTLLRGPWLQRCWNRWGSCDYVTFMTSWDAVAMDGSPVVLTDPWCLWVWALLVVKTGWYFCVALICVSLRTDDVWAFYPLEYLFFWCARSSLVPIFVLDCLLLVNLEEPFIYSRRAYVRYKYCTYPSLLCNFPSHA